jgi:hypothetical protein
VNRRPGGFVQEIETDDAVGVNVGMYWYGVLLVFDEDDFWGFCSDQCTLVGVNYTGGVVSKRTYGVALAEVEFQAVSLATVERIVIQDFDVHQPLLQIVCRN